MRTETQDPTYENPWQNTWKGSLELLIRTTCLATQSYGKPLIRTMTWAPLDKNAWASPLVPPATPTKSSPEALYTSMYRPPIWCLCLFNAISLCSLLIKRTNASPLRLPIGLKHRATPPLWNSNDSNYKANSIIVNDNSLYIILHYVTRDTMVLKITGKIKRRMKFMTWDNTYRCARYKEARCSKSCLLCCKK